MLFSDKRIHDAWRTVGEYSIFIEWGSGSQTVTFRNPRAYRGPFTFTQSHYLHPTTQGDPYHTSAPGGETVEEALGRAVATIMAYYRSARGEGYEPNSGWFVPNEDL